MREETVFVLLDDPRSHVYKDTLFLFLKGSLLYFEQRFSPSEAIGKYKRKTDVINIHGQRHEKVNRSTAAAQDKRSFAEDCTVPESTLRKKLKTETAPTSLDRFKFTFSNEEEK